MNSNGKKIILSVIVVLFAVVWGYFLLFKNREKESQTASFQQTAENKPIANGNFANLAPQTNDEGGVSVEAAPIKFERGKQIQFEISFTTHEGDLNFDLTKQAFLIDDRNREYLLISWDGGSGGHHLSGILIFPAIAPDAKSMKLIIKDIYGVKEREFSWRLKVD